MFLITSAVNKYVSRHNGLVIKSGVMIGLGFEVYFSSAVCTCSRHLQLSTYVANQSRSESLNMSVTVITLPTDHDRTDQST